ncbi:MULTISPECIES: hypothetical protein [unclassified Bartonella]|uniref:hypothetical protein n=1 Tax=unclassified Bartonella TaxID=2645622 RepID=UPI0035CF0E11
MKEKRDIYLFTRPLFIYETVKDSFSSLDEKGFVQFGYGIVRGAGIHAAACQMINPYHFRALSFWGGQIDNEALRQRGGF